MLQDVLDHIGNQELLIEAREFYESLPLTTDEFGYAVNRLHNAQQYASAGEHGAARFEVCLLHKRLKAAFSGQEASHVMR